VLHDLPPNNRPQPIDICVVFRTGGARVAYVWTTESFRANGRLDSHGIDTPLSDHEAFKVRVDVRGDGGVQAASTWQIQALAKPDDQRLD
jgi:hypothetical protein